MNSSMIGKIEKAHRYAQEPNRIRINGLNASFHGGHDDYTISLNDGHWTCSCNTFSSHVIGTCAHIMAIQQLLSPMLPDPLRFAVDEGPVSADGAAV